VKSGRVKEVGEGGIFGTSLHLMDFGGAIRQTRDGHACVVMVFFLFIFFIHHVLFLKH